MPLITVRQMHAAGRENQRGSRGKFIAATVGELTPTPDPSPLLRFSREGKGVLLRGFTDKHRWWMNTDEKSRGQWSEVRDLFKKEAQRLRRWVNLSYVKQCKGKHSVSAFKHAGRWIQGRKNAYYSSAAETSTSFACKCIGRESVNVVPLPGMLATCTEPRCAVTINFTSTNPNPAPGALRSRYSP